MTPVVLPAVLVGSGVELRAHSADIAVAMFRHVETERERLKRWLPWVDRTLTLQDEFDYIAHTLKCRDDMTMFDYGLYEPGSEIYMGSAGVHSISWDHERAELGYWIASPYEGRGFVSDACRVLEALLFETGFNRIEIRCNPANERSAVIPKRLGYTLDGRLRQNVIEDGGYRDTLVFSKLRGER